MQSLSQFGNLSVRFDMCITLKKLRSQNCTVKLHKLLHCWQSFPNEKAPFCIMERTKILMARFWEKKMQNWDIEEDYSSKKGQAITQFLSGLDKPARLSFSCSLDLLLNDIDQTNINRDIRDDNWLSKKHVFRPRGYQFVETNYVTPNEQLSTEQLVFFCHQQCYYNSFKGYQNCLVSAGLLGSCNP